MNTEKPRRTGFPAFAGNDSGGDIIALMTDMAACLRAGARAQQEILFAGPDGSLSEQLSSLQPPRR